VKALLAGAKYSVMSGIKNAPRFLTPRMVSERVSLFACQRLSRCATAGIAWKRIHGAVAAFYLKEFSDHS
jgi:hypothetical protein